MGLDGHRTRHLSLVVGLAVAVGDNFDVLFQGVEAIRECRFSVVIAGLCRHTPKFMCDHGGLLGRPVLEAGYHVGSVQRCNRDCTARTIE